jgi:hypothetical protein
MSEIDAAFDWFWGVLQGDFNEDQSTGQIVVGTAISMIPVLDQVADLRDLVANLIQIRQEPREVWRWVMLIITLIGLIPVLGSALKGVFKLVLKFAKHGGDAPKAIESILALLRGAGKGDPVRFLRTLPYDQYAKQVRARFDEFMNGLRTGLRRTTGIMSSKWVDWALGDTAKRLAALEHEMQRLQKLGHDMIPEGMQALKAKVDELLSHATPAKLDGSTDRTNTLVHSSKPLMRLEYEVGVRRIDEGVGKMRKAGASETEIAQWANQQRRDLGERFKNKTDPELREIIYKRNQAIYDDPLGPTYTELKRGYRVQEDGTKRSIGRGLAKTDAEITAGAVRAGGNDMPWDKILEFTAAKREGNTLKAQQLLKEIDDIVNGKRL